MYQKFFSKEAFKNKHIIISGGAGDIGLEIATEFSNSGAAKIALLDLHAENLEQSLAIFKNRNCEIINVTVDLSDENAVKNKIDLLYESEPVWDILVTAAGAVNMKPLLEQKVETWDFLMSINARSVFVLSTSIAKRMVSQGHGKIIHIGSSSTYFGTPGSGVYAASKAVVNQLTQTMAVEWGMHNIQVNAVCPTVADTKFLKFIGEDKSHERLRNKLKEKMPLHRLLEPADIAPIVLFLASDAAQLINGAIIPVDGGTRLMST